MEEQEWEEEEVVEGRKNKKNKIRKKTKTKKTKRKKTKTKKTKTKKNKAVYTALVAPSKPKITGYLPKDGRTDRLTHHLIESLCRDEKVGTGKK